MTLQGGRRLPRSDLSQRMPWPDNVDRRSTPQTHAHFALNFEHPEQLCRYHDPYCISTRSSSASCSILELCIDPHRNLVDHKRAELPLNNRGPLVQTRMIFQESHQEDTPGATFYPTEPTPPEKTRLHIQAIVKLQRRITQGPFSRAIKLVRTLTRHSPMFSHAKARGSHFKSLQGIYPNPKPVTPKRFLQPSPKTTLIDTTLGRAVRSQKDPLSYTPKEPRLSGREW